MPRFADILGQSAAVRLLRRLIDRDRLPHALLLVGRPGCGRRTLALAMAQTLLCPQRRAGDACGSCADCRLVADGIHPDLVALPGESDPVPAELLDLYEREEGRAAGADVAGGQLIPAAWTRIAVAAAASESSLRGRGRVFILPGVERLGGTAANALLKVLEEPPAGSRFILTCAAPGGVLPTIRSRAQAYRLADLDRAAVAGILERQGWDPPAARAAAARSQGSHRGLDDAADAPPVEELRELIAGGAHAGRIAALVDCLPAGAGEAAARRRILRGWLCALAEHLRRELRSADPGAAVAALGLVAAAERMLDRNQDARLVVEHLGLGA